jgi:hypothetical protein
MSEERSTVRRNPRNPTPAVEPPPVIKGSPLIPLAIVMVPLILLFLYGVFS